MTRTSIAAATAAAATAAALLGLSACAQMGPAPASAVNPAYPGTLLIGTLSGKGEIPGPGDPDGNGEFAGFFDVAGGKLCYDIGAGSLDPITMMHIHKGEPGVAGPPVITLATTDSMHGEGCVMADKALLADVIAHPASYYVNIHTSAYKAGAIRAQLMRK